MTTKNKIKFSSVTLKAWKKIGEINGGGYITGRFEQEKLAEILDATTPKEFLSDIETGFEMSAEGLRDEMDDERDDRNYVRGLLKDADKLEDLYYKFEASIIKDFKAAKVLPKK